jgi:hypothetical protein
MYGVYPTIREFYFGFTSFIWFRFRSIVRGRIGCLLSKDVKNR